MPRTKTATMKMLASTHDLKREFCNRIGGRYSQDHFITMLRRIYLARDVTEHLAWLNQQEEKYQQDILQGRMPEYVYRPVVLSRENHTWLKQEAHRQRDLPFHIYDTMGGKIDELVHWASYKGVLLDSPNGTGPRKRPTRAVQPSARKKQPGKAGKTGRERALAAG